MRGSLKSLTDVLMNKLGDTWPPGIVLCARAIWFDYFDLIYLIWSFDLSGRWCAHSRPSVYESRLYSSFEKYSIVVLAARARLWFWRVLYSNEGFWARTEPWVLIWEIWGPWVPALRSTPHQSLGAQFEHLNLTLKVTKDWKISFNFIILFENFFMKPNLCFSVNIVM